MQIGTPYFTYKPTTGTSLYTPTGWQITPNPLPSHPPYHHFELQPFESPIDKPVTMMDEEERREMLEKMNELLKLGHARRAAQTTYTPCDKCKLVHGDQGCI